MSCLLNQSRKPQVSIIIPVFNTARYLKQCFDSVLCQDIEKQVIIVNDGSTDESPIIISDYARQYAEIIVVNKVNGGLSSARNAGLEIAKGKFIGFVDSDDWIKENALKILINTAEEDNLDILAFEPILYYDENNMVPGSRNTKLSHKIFDGEDFFNSSIRYRSLQVPVCFHLFRRELLDKNRFRFVEGIYHEDWQFTPRTYFKAKRIKYINKNLYYYRKGVTSITAKTTLKHIRDLFFVAEELLNLEVSENLKSKRFLVEHVLGIYFSLLRISSHDVELSHFVIKQFQEIKLRTFALTNFILTTSLRTKFQILLLSLNVKLYILLVRIVKR